MRMRKQWCHFSGAISRDWEISSGQLDVGLQLGGASTALSEQPAERWDGVGVTAESSLRVEGGGQTISGKVRLRTWWCSRGVGGLLF